MGRDMGRWRTGLARRQHVVVHVCALLRVCPSSARARPLQVLGGQRRHQVGVGGGHRLARQVTDMAVVAVLLLCCDATGGMGHRMSCSMRSLFAFEWRAGLRILPESPSCDRCCICEVSGRVSGVPEVNRLALHCVVGRLVPRGRVQFGRQITMSSYGYLAAWEGSLAKLKNVRLSHNFSVDIS